MSQSTPGPKFFSVGDVAEITNIPTWRVMRVFEDGMLKEPPKFAGKRAIPGTMLPAVIDALRRRGWLPAEAQHEEQPIEPQAAAVQ